MLQVYEDIDLERDLVNAKDILDIIPRAASTIRGILSKRAQDNLQNNGATWANSDNGGKANDKPRGVPISVILQPIPIKLRSLIQTDSFRMNQLVVDEAFSIFGKLDDLHNRFTTLVDRTITHEEFIPKLAECVVASSDAFGGYHLRLLRMLRQFIRDIRNGASATSAEYILELASTLYTTYTTTENAELLPHQRPLVFLEKSLRDFLDFIQDIRALRGQADEHANELSSFLSTANDLRKAARHQSVIPLFIMTPSLDNSVAVVRFLALLRNRKTYHRRYLLYLENYSGAFPYENLHEPAYLLGKVDANGNLTWARDEEDIPDPNLLPTKMCAERLMYYGGYVLSNDSPLVSINVNLSFLEKYYQCHLTKSMAQDHSASFSFSAPLFMIKNRPSSQDYTAVKPRLNSLVHLVSRRSPATTGLKIWTAVCLILTCLEQWPLSKMQIIEKFLFTLVIV